MAAVQLAKLAGEATLFTALGNDEPGDQIDPSPEARGVRVRAVRRDLPQRRAVTLLDPEHERTIVTLGERLSPDGRRRHCPGTSWRSMDAIYFVSGDAEALRRTAAASGRAPRGCSPRSPRRAWSSTSWWAARRTRASATRHGDIEPPPRFVVRTAGAAGGELGRRGGPDRRVEGGAAAGPPVDAYGCGDSFAAGLTYGLAETR